MRKWLPIVMAPKNGTKFIGRDELGDVFDCRWVETQHEEDEDCWYSRQLEDEVTPLWWIPLPVDPQP